jgi:transposase
MTKRRKYSEEYKREVVTMATHSGITPKQLGEELGINATMIGRWRCELPEHSGKAFAGQDNPRDQELMKLKRERGYHRKYRTRGEYFALARFQE